LIELRVTYSRSFIKIAPFGILVSEQAACQRRRRHQEFFFFLKK
jgi:hypothetical protein